MRVALDTNRLTDLFRGHTALADFLGTCEEVWLPLIVLGEIKAGFYGGTQQDKNGVLLQKLLAKPTVGILYPGRETAGQYARLFCSARAAQAQPTNPVPPLRRAGRGGLCPPPASRP